VNDETRAAALRVIDSGSYVLGKEGEAFEAELAAFIGTKHAIICSSWTAGVFLLHQTMGLKGGDEVIVPSHTAFPSIEPLMHYEAKPVFVDIDETYCLDVDLIEAAITPRTVGILPVHLYGHPVDLDPILEIATKHGLWVMEDCAQAIGARYKNRMVGSIGVAGGFSFYPSKNLTVLGDGGCITTNDNAIAGKIRMLRNHGRNSKYLHEFAGYNQRLGEIQSAIGRVALRHLEELNEQRRQIAARYNERLAGMVQTPVEQPWAKPVYHMYVIQTEGRDELAKYLKEKGIGTGIHYPVANHQQPAVKNRYSDLPALLKTELVVERILSLPIYGELLLEEADLVCDAVAEFFGKS
jgi:dTDP-4-amino-4,6-dideoxygalactose transaminase